ncbi:hypothetical protein H9Q72_002002 [Fusarium xylarioides]|uniref:Heterokaryon incompatibility domain-containing protein n=1 Tax=Fusarium xylarioides TaxID=221167 RepID=A0A9P7I9D5_9HYPO|nr:hypothetical protein H9Q70_005055 [Fusarium xylarioides]KAG5771408.1 hypothetical protein H9Q72_002002 [Fusarium xylarioides]
MHDKLDTGAFWMQMPNTRDRRAKLGLPDFGLELYTLQDAPCRQPRQRLSRDRRFSACQRELSVCELHGYSSELDERMRAEPFMCQSKGGEPLPKRVVDVGPQDGSRAPALYVSQGEIEPYAALSHCWGKSNLLKTTTATLASRIHGIEWSELSTTFQEAILVTRDLGLRYLWIDSLCIVQDDTADWEEQAMRMGDIYASAYVTISATGSSDGSGGLMRTPGTWNSEGFLPELGKKYFARVELEEEAFTKGTVEARDDSLGYPLLTRGWCFQERILSARVLHYTPGGIFYECRTGSRCETRLGSEPSLKAVYAHELQKSKTGLLEDRLRAWGTMLEDYTTKMLTFQKDTLPALSSVARQFVGEGMGRYLAGLWEEGLVSSLLWESRLDADPDFGASRGNAINLSRPDDFVAPTFSWASRVGPIKTLNQMIQNWVPCASIMETECKPSGTDPYGMVSGGHVKIRGNLLEASFHSKACALGKCADIYNTAYRNRGWGARLVAESPDPKCHIVIPGLPMLDITVDSEQDARLEVGAKVYCLQLVEFPEQQFGTWFDAIEDAFSTLRVSERGGPAEREWRADVGDDDHVEIQYRGRWAPGYRSPIRRRSDSMLRHRYKADIEAGLLPPDAVPPRRERSQTPAYVSGDSRELSPLSEWDDEPDQDSNLDSSSDDSGHGQRETEEVAYESDQEQFRLELRGGGLSSDEDAVETDSDDDEGVITWDERRRRFLTASLDGKPSTTCGVLILRQAADGTFTRIAASSRFPTNIFKAASTAIVTIV